MCTAKVLAIKNKHEKIWATTVQSKWQAARAYAPKSMPLHIQWYACARLLHNYRRFKVHLNMRSAPQISQMYVCMYAQVTKNSERRCRSISAPHKSHFMCAELRQKKETFEMCAFFNKKNSRSKGQLFHNFRLCHIKFSVSFE